jgi:RimJ/RimL family protein N-acetyltransferase
MKKNIAMSFHDTPLIGQHVRLEPLQQHHLPGLKTAIEDGQLHQLMVTTVSDPEKVDEFFKYTQKMLANGSMLTYATIAQKTNQVIGSSRLMNTDWEHQRTEIGGTFIAKSHQRTAINTEAKYLMLGHAFEQLNMNRVAFRTDFLNHQSRTAIERLGAKFEGILRNHMVMPDGRIRDTVVYSIIKHEWPGIKAFLEEKLS